MENTVVSREVIDFIIGADIPPEVTQGLSSDALSDVIDTIFWAFEADDGAINYRNVYDSSMARLIEHHKQGRLQNDFWEIAEIMNRTILSITTAMKTQAQDF